jgi:hypothetical protein
MRMRVLVLALAVLLAITAAAQTRVDPKISSMYPFSGQRGTTFTATVRGTGLAGASAAIAEDAPFTLLVEKVESEPPPETAGRKRGPTDLVTLQVHVKDNAQPGRYPLRLVTRYGITNALPVHVVDLPVLPEPAGSHDSQESAIAAPGVPAILAGRLSRRGEADLYAFSAAAGQTLTFEVVSGLPQTASAGSAATVANFDPALTIFDTGGTWFDSGRLKRIAHNDEPVWVFGRPTDAHLAHRFTKSGKYLLRVEAFSGQGGPDYSYHVRITPGELPHDPPAAAIEWQERVWTRKLGSDRLNRLSSRGGRPEDQKSVETYRASSDSTAFKLPGTVEGSISRPGESHRAGFRVDGPADIAIEIETPAAGPPFFNPIVRLLDGSGTEVATNVFAGRGACSGAMTKSLQAKTLVPLRNPGEYTLEIRDATADLAGPDFMYRVQVRPQVPHVGQVRIDTDHLNFIPGEAKTMRVTFDREEDYRGGVMVTAENLPPGLSAAAGADFEPDKDDPPVLGKRERYTPRTERAVLVLTAGVDAPPSSQPHVIRVVARPVIDGKAGEILASKDIYVMVIDKP